MSSTIGVNNVADVAAVLCVGMRGGGDHHAVGVGNVLLDVESPVPNVVLETGRLKTVNQGRVGEVVEVLDVVDHLGTSEDLVTENTFQFHLFLRRCDHMDFGFVIIHWDSNIHPVSLLVMRHKVRAHKIVIAIIAHVQVVSFSSMLD